MYRTIDTATWTDQKVRQLPPLAKLLFLYLITNSHAHVSGIYYLADPTGCFDLGISQEEYRRGIDTLSGAGLVRNDQENSLIWVCKMLRYQGSGPKVYAAAGTHLASLHESELLAEFLEFYPEVASFYTTAKGPRAGSKKNRADVVHKSLRFKILKRDRFTCQYCGAKAPHVQIEVDHVIPVSRGGKTVEGNLKASCLACNQAKGDTLSEGNPAQDCIHSQEQEQEQEQEQKQILSPSAATGKTSLRPRDLLFDAVAAITGSDPKVSGSHIGKVCKALRAAEPPYTPEEVHAFPDAIGQAGMSFTITLGSIEKYIGLVRNQPVQPIPIANPNLPNGRPKQDLFHGQKEFLERHRNDRN